jgi:predicted dienelactone hydrolase
VRRTLLIVLVGGMVAAAPAASSQSYKVGVAERVFLRDDPGYDWRGAKTHALVCLVWYPAEAQAVEQPQWVGDPPHAFASMGEAAPDAALQSNPAKFPLILLSHGTGGSAAMMAWLGTELARHGYIAVAVNHPGNNATEPHTVQGFTLGWERAADLSQMLDKMLTDKEFGPRIDAQRIGAAGFSLGGYTMIVVAGGRSNPIQPDLLAKECAKPGTMDLVCYDPPEFAGLTEQAIALAHSDPDYAAALGKSAESHRDARVRAVFAVAPVDLRFTRASLAAIRIPVAIVVGAADPLAVPATNAELLAREIPGAQLTIWPGGVAHYTFLDTCTSTGRQQAPDLCVDKPGVDRDAVHAETAQKAVGFFDKSLGK